MENEFHKSDYKKFEYTIQKISEGSYDIEIKTLDMLDDYDFSELVLDKLVEIVRLIDPIIELSSEDGEISILVENCKDPISLIHEAIDMFIEMCTKHNIKRSTNLER